MKVCYFASDYPPTGGGISTYVVEWLSAISSIETVSEVRAFIFGNKLPRTEKIGSLTVTTRKERSFLRIGYETLRHVLTNLDADVFHALYVFPVGFWMVFWARLLGQPTVLTIYGADICSQGGSRLSRFFKRLTILMVHRVVSISESTKRLAIEAGALEDHEDKIRVIYNSVPKVSTSRSKPELMNEAQKIKEKYAPAHNAFVILSVCRLVKRKGVEYLIRAVRQTGNPKVVLLVAGTGPEMDRLAELIKSERLNKQVFLLGNVVDLAPLYTLADVVALTSCSLAEEGDIEGLGLVLLEGQSFGKPVIGTSSGGIPEAFEPGKTGLLVPECDVRALTEAINMFSGDISLREEMGRRTGAFLKRRFGRERLESEYLEMLREITP